MVYSYKYRFYFVLMMLFLPFISFAQLQSLNLQLAEQYMYSGHQQGFYTVADTKTLNYSPFFRPHSCNLN